jgi:hypothetical protein
MSHLWYAYGIPLQRKRNGKSMVQTQLCPFDGIFMAQALKYEQNSMSIA